MMQAKTKSSFFGTSNDIIVDYSGTNFTLSNDNIIICCDYDLDEPNKYHVSYSDRDEKSTNNEQEWTLHRSKIQLFEESECKDFFDYNSVDNEITLKQDLSKCLDFFRTKGFTAMMLHNYVKEYDDASLIYSINSYKPQIIECELINCPNIQNVEFSNMSIALEMQSEIRDDDDKYPCFNLQLISGALVLCGYCIGDDSKPIFKKLVNEVPDLASNTHANLDEAIDSGTFQIFSVKTKMGNDVHECDYSQYYTQLKQYFNINIKITVNIDVAE